MKYISFGKTHMVIDWNNRNASIILKHWISVYTVKIYIQVISQSKKRKIVLTTTKVIVFDLSTQLFASS